MVIDSRCFIPRPAWRMAPVAAFLLAACGGGGDATTQAAAASPATAAAQPAVAPVIRPMDIDLAACLAAARETAAAATGGCPGFVMMTLTDAVAQCGEVGGELKSAVAADARALDVDADGVDEVLYDFTANYYCDGAPSIFSCGSLGCPTVLYGRRGSSWVALGVINAEDSPGIELLAAPDGGRYATLRGGCAGDRPCNELTHYAWDGTNYERSIIEADSSIIDVAPGGLQTLVADTTVVASPAADAPGLDRYPAGTDFVVIGTVRGTAYLYVSPCNACRRGFVPASALRK